MKIPHDWQYALIAEAELAWQQPGVRNVLMRADTGAGKTVMLAELIRRYVGASCVTAHRHELTLQISMALADQGIYHDLIVSDKSRKAIAQEHVAEYGKCFYRPGAQCKVASVQTLARAKGLDSWARQVTLVINDEGHHHIRDNACGKTLAMFSHPFVKMLFPTATPRRADGKGLGRHHDGLVDVMIQAPPMRWLIDNGYLTDYDIVCPTSDLVMLKEPGASGDWSPEQLREAVKHSHIVGDVVRHYLADYPDGHGRTISARGKRCVTFCTDVETAQETTAAFLAAGVPTATLTGETDSGVRRDILARLKSGKLLNICTVDIVSEGFDLPAIEAVIMARPTQSLALYMQQFGRALRVLAGKLRAIIIDCVSNLIRHGGPPDRPRPWSLDRRDKRGKSAPDDAIPIRICVECVRPYERVLRACPFCGHEPIPAGRSGPAAVDGDVGLMDAETLRKLRGEIDAVDAPAVAVQADLTARHVPSFGIPRLVRAHNERQAAQHALRTVMARWGGHRKQAGDDDPTMQRRFWLEYGVDVLSAQALGPADADALRLRVVADLT